MSNSFLESEVRQKIIEAIRKDLLGPNKPDESLSGRPNIEYITGILHPSFENQESFDATDVADYGLDSNKFESRHPEENSTERNEKKLINSNSVGLSFYVDKNTEILSINLDWGDYFSQKVEKNGITLEEKSLKSEKKKDEIRYNRVPKHYSIKFLLNKFERTSSKTIEHENVEVSILKYELKNNFSLISVFVTNKRPANDEVESMMFQVNLSVSCVDGFISESIVRGIDVEDEYYYIDKPVYARGRGCAASWIINENECNEVHTDFIPEQEINKVSADFDEFEPNFFSTWKFSDFKNKIHNIADLKFFALKYQEWIDELKNSPKKIYFNKRMNYFNAIISNCQNAHDRISRGVEELEKNDVAYHAFTIMNRVIYTQNAIKRFSKKHAENEDCNLNQFSFPDELIDFQNSKNKFCWRPFQLAFILLNLTGIIHPDNSEREIVDLLYFPTGGGKTEAYLGLMAFTIFNRRLNRNNVTNFNLDGGVTIILRYTLRLLTTQQRDRITKMIVAAEYIRNSNSKLYGNERISIGFWVGDGVVSNKFLDFIPDKNGDKTKAEENKRNAAKQVPTCPFCGRPMHYYSDDDPIHKVTENSYEFDNEKKELRIYCLDKNCFFYKYKEDGNRRSLPIYLIDEEIYNKCPTIVLGTVDKFASIPWNVEINSLFGRVDRKCTRHGYIAIGSKHSNSHNSFNGLPKAYSTSIRKFLPPELIVQDELHLITGPLGTIYGGYETMIERLCSYELNGKIIQPKYIVSTATIKNAAEQINALYGRRHFQFPPSGLDASDSYFIREVPLEKEPFRKYLGICANGSSMKTTLLRTFAVALQEVKNLSNDLKYKDAIDPYYTLVGYFNSIRELGGAARLIQDDIPDRIKRLCKMHKYPMQRFLNDKTTKEITSRIRSELIKKELDSLEVSYTSKDCIDIVIATNMIAVGMDVDRLGLMCVLGQPKQNSEYIQATSRIGRSHPGLVLSLYNPYRPRDLSHYENFVAYHKQLYRYVEGTTATPFAARARDRFLHALVIAGIRLYYSNMAQDAKNITSMTQSEIDDVINIIVDRMSIVDPSIIIDGKREIEHFINEWKNQVIADNDVVYYGKDNGSRIRLMVPYSESHKDIEKGTLQSMREVDQNSGLYLFEGDNI